MIVYVIVDVRDDSIKGVYESRKKARSARPFIITGTIGDMEVSDPRLLRIRRAKLIFFK